MQGLHREVHSPAGEPGEQRVRAATKQRNTPRAVGLERSEPFLLEESLLLNRDISPALNHGEFTYCSIGTKSGVGLGWE